MNERQPRTRILDNQTIVERLKEENKQLKHDLENTINQLDMRNTSLDCATKKLEKLQAVFDKWTHDVITEFHFHVILEKILGNKLT